MKHLPSIIGLVGRAGSGKDTAAGHLASYGYRRVALADPVREMALDINPMIGVEDTHPVYLADVVDRLGWERAKRHYPEVRRFLQRLGTDGVRQHIAPNWWIYKTMQRVEAEERAVVTDVRFANEAEDIRWAGGLLIRLHRRNADDLGANGLHASEQEFDLIRCDAEIEAETIEALYDALDSVLQNYREENLCLTGSVNS